MSFAPSPLYQGYIHGALFLAFFFLFGCEIRNVPTAVDRTVSSTKILGFFVKKVPITIRHENIGIAPYSNSYQVHGDIDTSYFTTAPRTAKQGVQQSPCH